MKTYTQKKAFTLMEILVVISLLALLIAMLMPALAKSKESSRRVVCASNLRQLTYIMNIYAESSDSKLPAFHQNFGMVPRYVDKQFIELITETYQIPHDFLFCPSAPSGWIKNIRLQNQTTLTSTQSQDYERQICQIGYFLWVPRKVSNFDTITPPSKNDWPYIADPNPFQGPEKTTDRFASFNPVLTDQVQTTDSSVNLETYNLIEDYLCHQWNNRIEMTNQAFIDGHIEKIPASSMLPRFGTSNGTSWAWR